MPNLIGALDDTVEYGQFVVQEVSMLRSPLTLPVPAGEWVAVGGPGGLLSAVCLRSVTATYFESGIERWLIQMWQA